MPTVCRGLKEGVEGKRTDPIPDDRADLHPLSPHVDTLITHEETFLDLAAFVPLFAGCWCWCTGVRGLVHRFISVAVAVRVLILISSSVRLGPVGLPSTGGTRDRRDLDPSVSRGDHTPRCLFTCEPRSGGLRANVDDDRRDFVCGNVDVTRYVVA